MAEVRRAARSARMVLVIDDTPASRPPWLVQLEALFSVVTIATLAGASVAIERQDVAAVVLVLTADGQRPRAWVNALRGHRVLERTSIFVLAPDSALVAADLFGLPDVDVIEPEIADFDLSLRVGRAASRMGSRPVPKRSSDPLQGPDTRTLESLVPKEYSPLQTLAPRAADAWEQAADARGREYDARLQRGQPLHEPRLLQRFCQDCVARGERGLALCELLSRRDAPATERVHAADELSGLFTAGKADAELLALRDLAALLGLAERVASRLDVGKGQLVVPRGVIGLLAALQELAGQDQLLKFDFELHRTRLASAIER